MESKNDSNSPNQSCLEDVNAGTYSIGDSAVYVNSFIAPSIVRKTVHTSASKNEIHPGFRDQETQESMREYTHGIYTGYANFDDTSDNNMTDDAVVVVAKPNYTNDGLPKKK